MRLGLPRRTVRLRLTLLYGGVFLLSGVALLAVTYVLVGQTTSGPNYSVKLSGANKGAIVRGPHGDVSVSVLQIAASVPTHGSSAGQALPAASGEVVSEASHSVLATTSGRDGAAAKASGGPLRVSPGEARAVTKEVKEGGVAQQAGGAGAQHAFSGVKLSRGGPPLTITQARDQAHKLEQLGRQQHSEEMHQLLVDLGIALAIVAILSMGLGWFLAGRVLRPLQTITKAARAISAKSLHRRLGLRGPRDELRELGDTFDELLERLERSFEAQRQFVANASHELRTPLTLERAIVEVTLADSRASNETLRATCERVLAIGEQQERMIEALLALARSERGLERRDPFDLSELARDVIVARNPELSSRGLHLESELEEAHTLGDASLAERLVANLIDNAIRHNVAEGWVSVATAVEDGRATLTVSNSGPLVLEDDVERLFRPFQRSGVARASHGDGHGLGLSIVSAVATAHGANLQVRARPDGGLEISASFAASAPSELDGSATATAARPAAASARGSR